MATVSRPALNDDERDVIVVAVKSAFAKLKKRYEEIAPTFQAYGFTPPSPGVIARDLSEKIEASIVQHCASFSKGEGHCDLSRAGQEWEVKICKDSGLTINQSKTVNGENYIVANYKSAGQVIKVWVLWNAQDHFFSPRRPNTNARSLLHQVAAPNIDILFTAPKGKTSVLPRIGKAKTAKATLAKKSFDKTA